MTFGTRLKQLRLSEKLTQTELADILHVQKSSISRYENDKQIPEVNLLIKLADHFKVSVDFLLCLDEIDSEVISLALKIMQLNEADKKRILNYIDIALYKE